MIIQIIIRFTLELPKKCVFYFIIDTKYVLTLLKRRKNCKKKIKNRVSKLRNGKKPKTFQIFTLYFALWKHARPKFSPTVWHRLYGFDVISSDNFIKINTFLFHTHKYNFLNYCKILRKIATYNEKICFFLFFFSGAFTNYLLLLNFWKVRSRPKSSESVWKLSYGAFLHMTTFWPYHYSRLWKR